MHDFLFAKTSKKSDFIEMDLNQGNSGNLGAYGL